MYVDDSTYTRNGKTYRRVLLRNSYRENGKVRHDTLANLSTCSDEAIEAIKLGFKNKNQLDTLKANGKPVKAEQGLQVGGVWVLWKLAQRLGVAQALGQTGEALLCLWLVFATLIAQGSRLSAVRLAQRHAVCDRLPLNSFHEDHLYAAMDWLAEQQDVIERQLFKQHYGRGEAPVLYLYDVTSSYFEGQENELADDGYNRDGKRGKKQIVVGCLTDAQGRPVSIQVFRGNTSDPKTFKAQIDKVSDDFGIEQVTFVGDRGMIKSAPITDLQEASFHHITAITKPQIESLISQGVIQLDLFDDRLAEVEQEAQRYVLRRNPARAAEIAQNREEKWQRLIALVEEKNIYLKEHPRAKPETAIQSIKARMQKLKISEWVNIELAPRAMEVTQDNEHLAELSRLDGCYVIKTDLPQASASKETVHQRYQDLTQVEGAFRTMKTALLEMRGIFVRKETRTRAHVFIVMLAYLLADELKAAWKDLDVTVAEGLSVLSDINTIELVFPNELRCQTIPTPRALGRKLLKRLNLTLPDAIPHRGIVIETRKKLPERRNS